jgi:signal peptidase II
VELVRTSQAKTRQIPSRVFWFVLIALAVVALDQVTKLIIDAKIERGEAWPSEDWPVRIIRVTNSGAAFGMLEGEVGLLTVTSIIGVFAIVAFLRSPSFHHPLAYTSLALMLGGAIGNLIDRVRLGYVLDFVKFPEFPAFNAADSAISIGVVLLICHFLLNPQPETARET